MTNPTFEFRFHDLAGRTVLITGAATGIGKGISLGLAQQGMRLILVDRNEAELRQTAEELRGGGASIETALCDLSDPASRADLAARVVGMAPTLDGLIHNAGVYPRMPLERTTLDFFRQIMAVNVEPALELTRDLLANLERSKAGRVVLLSSITFEIGAAMLSAYVASKGALVGLTRSLAHELGPRGINVNAISPGAVVVERDAARRTPERDQRILSWQSVKRRIFPADMIGPVCLLLSDAGGAINGEVIEVSGGVLHPLADGDFQRARVEP